MAATENPEIPRRRAPTVDDAAVLGLRMLAQATAGTKLGGDFKAAILQLRDAIILGSRRPDVILAFMAALGRLKRLPPSLKIEHALRIAFKSHFVPTHLFVSRVTAVLMNDAAFAGAFAFAQSGNRAGLMDLMISGQLRSTFANILFLMLLQSTVVCSPELEFTLTCARRHLLLSTHQCPLDSPHPTDRVFCSALATQCFLNEYAYYAEADEERSLIALARDFGERLASDAATETYAAAVLGCYGSLSQYSWAEQLAKQYPNGGSPGISDVLNRQVVEPAIEAELTAKIPALKPITDATSQKVKQLYEENPYPQWTLPYRRPEAPVREVLRTRFPGADFTYLDGITRPEILVAGCGTGIHIMTAVAGYGAYNVTAIDLSRRSLAYAMRKMHANGIRNVRFLEADILDVSLLGYEFDIIECAGVLHHMADPMAGWRALVNQLRAGGVMLVGLYSAAARRGIEAARKYAVNQNYAPTYSGIRNFRRDVLAALRAPESNSPARSIVDSRIEKLVDFYSISSCRDLIFHVRESTYSLSEVAQMIASLDLRFRGFLFPTSAHVDAYRLRFPDDPSGTNLANWDQLEAANPDTFVSMYNFVVQKP